MNNIRPSQGASPLAHIAQRTLAAGRAGKEFCTLPNHNAALQAIGRTLALQTPHPRWRSGVFGGYRVRDALDRAEKFIRVTLLEEVRIVAGQVRAQLSVLYGVAFIAPQLLPLGLGTGRLPQRMRRQRLIRAKYCSASKD